MRLFHAIRPHKHNVQENDHSWSCSKQEIYTCRSQTPRARGQTVTVHDPVHRLVIQYAKMFTVGNKNVCATKLLTAASLTYILNLNHHDFSLSYN